MNSEMSTTDSTHHNSFTVNLENSERNNERLAFDPSVEGVREGSSINNGPLDNPTLFGFQPQFIYIVTFYVFFLFELSRNISLPWILFTIIFHAIVAFIPIFLIYSYIVRHIRPRCLNPSNFIIISFNTSTILWYSGWVLKTVLFTTLAVCISSTDFFKLLALMARLELGQRLYKTTGVLDMFTTSLQGVESWKALTLVLSTELVGALIEEIGKFIMLRWIIKEMKSSNNSINGDVRSHVAMAVVIGAALAAVLNIFSIYWIGASYLLSDLNGDTWFVKFPRTIVGALTAIPMQVGCTVLVSLGAFQHRPARYIFMAVMLHWLFASISSAVATLDMYKETHVWWVWLLSFLVQVGMLVSLFRNVSKKFESIIAETDAEADDRLYVPVS